MKRSWSGSGLRSKLRGRPSTSVCLVSGSNTKHTDVEGCSEVCPEGFPPCNFSPFFSLTMRRSALLQQKQACASTDPPTFASASPRVSRLAHFSPLQCVTNQDILAAAEGNEPVPAIDAANILAASYQVVVEVWNIVCFYTPVQILLICNPSCQSQTIIHTDTPQR